MAPKRKRPEEQAAQPDPLPQRRVKRTVRTHSPANPNPNPNPNPPESPSSPNNQAVLSPLSPGTIRVAAPVSVRRGAADMGSIAVKENGRPSDLVAPEITYHAAWSDCAATTPGQDVVSTAHGHSRTAPKPPTLLASDRLPLRTDRNIDKVVLGNLCFRTWYPSYYGKEVLGDTSGNAKGGSKDGAKDTGGKAQSKKDKEHQPMLERLYVCPSCFKYAKELVAWWGHVKMCQQKGYIPGKKIYVHPRGARTVYIPQDNNKGPGPKKRRGEGGVRYVEEIVQDEGEWSIWEVDGEMDVLFCQNLSLFAKLFLDNKSVFFDVTGFNYFLLVYTPPPLQDVGGAGSSAAVPTPQITGFFSKEKMSWDNNNLACILVFPPWQRKGLGALLMGASYEISRREGIMGGPEKPISDLGKKGYKRFWSGEIARWLLSLEVGQEDGQETIVDIEDCSQGTWISPEDCLMILREMGVLEDAGMGPGKPEPVEEPQSQLSDEDKRKKQGSNEEETKQQTGRGGSGVADTEEDKQKSRKPAKEVRRIRVDKEAVRLYVTGNRIPLDKACDPNGFVEGYAVKVAEKAQSEESEVQTET
ncbi:Males-absent on the first protein [Cladobotryum mycophilum]|uniref:histone acetyltransferase n=1 Tax=Cladobotryum mycophilum TaxID=491253 RepID=A0ABR0STR8_9HYPO